MGWLYIILTLRQKINTILFRYGYSPTDEKMKKYFWNLNQCYNIDIILYAMLVSCLSLGFSQVKYLITHFRGFKVSTSQSGQEKFGYILKLKIQN